MKGVTFLLAIILSTMLASYCTNSSVIEDAFELIEEFVAQGQLSRKYAIDKMITSIYYSEWGSDQPQNYFTWS